MNHYEAEIRELLEQYEYLHGKATGDVEREKERVRFAGVLAEKVDKAVQEARLDELEQVIKLASLGKDKNLSWGTTLNNVLSHTKDRLDALKKGDKDEREVSG